MDNWYRVDKKRAYVTMIQCYKFVLIISWSSQRRCSVLGLLVIQRSATTSTETANYITYIAREIITYPHSRYNQ